MYGDEETEEDEEEYAFAVIVKREVVILALGYVGCGGGKDSSNTRYLHYSQR